MRKGTLKRALAYLGASKFAILLSAIFALISVGLTLYTPILVGEAIDLLANGSGSVDFEKLLKLILTAILLVGVTAVLQWIMAAVNNRICHKAIADMRKDAFGKLGYMPISYVDKNSHGDTVNRIINDTERFGEGLLLGASQVFVGILTIIGTLAFMVAINYKIAIVVFLLTPISILIAKFIGKRTFNMFRERSECEGKSSAYISEMLANEKLVLAFSREKEAIKDFSLLNRKTERATLSAIFFSSLTNPTTRFVNSLVYAATALVGALSVVATAGAAVPFTVGSFTCLLSYTNQYTKPFNEISGLIAEFQNALASASRVFELMENEPEKPDSPDAAPLTEVKGRVEFCDVSFSYDQNKPLIEGLSVNIPAGARVAIVGPTGCGKTTLINLLMRFYDLDSGRIVVDGVPADKIKRKSLRQSYGMVLQDTWLMSGTVKENIAFAKPDATDEEIISAAKAAHAHSFIKRLKDGYDTKIGEGGVKLSEGQRQLLCIARIMLNTPPMLILDEATSSIDTRTEMRIQRAFSKITKGRTSFIVAHRLSTIADADIILVMKDGKIVEIGKHEELLRAGGFYKFLHDSRTLGLKTV